MKEFGFFKEGKLLERFDTLEEAFEPFKALPNKEVGVFRRLRFDELSEEEKLEKMETRLHDLKTFLEMGKGTGRMIQSHTNIYQEELDWLLSMARDQVNKEKEKNRDKKETIR